MLTYFLSPQKKHQSTAFSSHKLLCLQFPQKKRIQLHIFWDSNHHLWQYIGIRFSNLLYWTTMFAEQPRPPRVCEKEGVEEVLQNMFCISSVKCQDDKFNACEKIFRKLTSKTWVWLPLVWSYISRSEQAPGSEFHPGDESEKMIVVFRDLLGAIKR